MVKSNTKKNNESLALDGWWKWKKKNVFDEKYANPAICICRSINKSTERTEAVCVEWKHCEQQKRAHRDSWQAQFYRNFILFHFKFKWTINFSWVDHLPPLLIRCRLNRHDARRRFNVMCQDTKIIHSFIHALFQSHVFFNKRGRSSLWSNISNTSTLPTLPAQNAQGRRNDDDLE